MHKVILTLSALLFGLTGCSFTLSTYGGGGSEGPAPWMASRGDTTPRRLGKPARRVPATDPPRTEAKQPAITWAGEVPEKKPAIAWAGEVPKKKATRPAKKQPAITWAGEVPKQPKKQATRPAKKQPAITWAGEVPPAPR